MEADEVCCRVADERCTALTAKCAPSTRTPTPRW